MKQVLFIAFSLLCLGVTLAAFRSSVETPKAPETAEYGVVYGNDGLFAPESPEALSSAMQASTNPIYQIPETIDTITNTENDTLPVPSTLISLWSYNHTIDITSLSGTVSVIAILQENNERTGGTWYEVERDTAAAATTLRLHGKYNSSQVANGLGWVKGVRQRLILDGNGTQSTRYIHNCTFKK